MASTRILVPSSRGRASVCVCLLEYLHAAEAANEPLRSLSEVRDYADGADGPGRGADDQKQTELTH